MRAPSATYLCLKRRFQHWSPYCFEFLIQSTTHITVRCSVHSPQTNSTRKAAVCLRSFFPICADSKRPNGWLPCLFWCWISVRFSALFSNCLRICGLFSHSRKNGPLFSSHYHRTASGPAILPDRIFCVPRALTAMGINSDSSSFAAQLKALWSIIIWICILDTTVRLFMWDSGNSRRYGPHSQYYGRSAAGTSDKSHSITAQHHCVNIAQPLRNRVFSIPQWLQWLRFWLNWMVLSA